MRIVLGGNKDRLMESLACSLLEKKKKKMELRSVNSAALWERQVYDRSLLYVKLTVGLGLPWQNYYRTRKTLQ